MLHIPYIYICHQGQDMIVVVVSKNSATWSLTVVSCFWYAGMMAYTCIVGSSGCQPWDGGMQCCRFHLFTLQYRVVIHLCTPRFPTKHTFLDGDINRAIAMLASDIGPNLSVGFLRRPPTLLQYPQIRLYLQHLSRP